MDKIKLEKDIQEIELKLVEMKKELLKEEEKIFPQKNDKYYYIDTEGEIKSSIASDSDGRFKVFRTKEEAQNFYEIECARQRVKDEIKRLNDGWTPDWTNNNESKYFTRLRENKLAIESYKYSKDLDNSMYLKDYASALKIIDSHEEDLILILGQ